jgi:hypothetical protein
MLAALVAFHVDAQTKKPPAKSKTAAKKSTASSKKKKSSRTTWRNRQTAPTPERYREIQSALKEKGYLKPEEVTGTWNATSTDALKRFQGDQKIEGAGRINSLSLIALGLGPKYEARNAPAPPRPSGSPNTPVQSGPPLR